MNRIVISLIFVLIILDLFGQSRTIIAYDLQTGEVEKIEDVFVPNLSKDRTNFNIGSHSSLFAYLPTNLDNDNLFEESQWTTKTPAVDDYNLEDFPFRTSIKIIGVEQDSLMDNCSGIMISSRHVLTAAHCIFWGDLDTVHERFLACPIYDQGEFNATFDCSYVSKVYFLENWSFWGEDFAILELEESIGFETGWVGIGYDNDLENESTLLHKFSYPATWDLYNKYNGDTLYYSYGIPDIFDELNIGFTGALGVGGESGSSIIEVENGESYTSYGVFTWIDDSKHSRIQKEYYYPFLEVISDDLVSHTSSVEENRLIEIYPTLATEHLYFDSASLQEKEMLIQIYNLNGSLLLKTYHSINKPLDVKALDEGYYFIRVSDREYDWVYRFVKV